MAKIKTIHYQEATGRLKEIYDDLIRKRGKLASVHTIQSLRPESIVRHMELYLEIMFSASSLTRAEREMMAVVVSIANGCNYCKIHHGEALNHYWRDSIRLDSFYKDFRNTNLNERELGLCDFAQKLTHHPSRSQEDDYVKGLTSLGLSDEGILDATLVVAYFNFVNRIVMALGVDLEEDGAGGYSF
jgi:uncharacterized peroxidase-related enzyme